MTDAQFRQIVSTLWVSESPSKRSATITAHRTEALHDQSWVPKYAAYTFELSKCYEQTIKERQLLALANIDADLCQKVADGLGLDVPAPTVTPEETSTTAAISQLGGDWPVAGRIVGVVIGSDSDQVDIQAVRSVLLDAKVLPLVVGPRGGVIGSVTVQRTYANAASIEFDAIVIVGDTPPAPDALPSLDTKSASEGGPDTAIDPRIAKLLGEAWRHAKAIGTTDATSAASALLPTGAPGTVHGTPTSVAKQIIELLASHRVWQRFPTSTST